MTERIPLYLDSSGVSSEIPMGDTVAASRLDLTDYLKLSGRAGGQTVYGGTAAVNNLNLNSTSNVLKGSIIFDGLGVIQIASAVTLRTNTSDGSDNSWLELCGGSGPVATLGAFAIAYGNEATGAKGDLVLAAGAGDGGSNRGRIQHVSNSLLAIETKSRVASPGVSGFNTAFTSGTSTDNSTTGSGTAAISTVWSFSQPTIVATNSSVTHTDAATIYVANAPIAGTNITITNPWSLLIAAGGVRFDESLIATSGTKRAFFVQTIINPASNSAANLYSQQISLSVLGTVDKTGTIRAANFTGSVDAACNVTLLQGFNALVQIGGISGNSKVATSLMGANFGIANLASSYTVTNGYGWKVQAPINSGGGTLSNVCGGAIENHTAGGKNTNLLIGTSTIPTDQNWSIYNSSAYSNYFAGNIGIGGTTFGSNATNTLLLKNGTVPGTSIADTVQLFSVDISAANASLGIRTETAVVTESVTPDRTLSVNVNGTNYKICLKS